jgi:hypothetical protein
MPLEVDVTPLTLEKCYQYCYIGCSTFVEVGILRHLKVLQ